MRFPDAQSVFEEAAERWIRIASQAVAESGSFSVALSGGSTPRSLYELLASAPYRDQVDWEKTHVFWGDERRVARDDEQSNYRMAYESLLSHVPIPGSQIHPIDGMGLSSGIVRDYDDAMWKHFRYERGGWPRFDLMLLGMGEDGHVASIFPGTRTVSDLSSRVIVYQVPQLGVERITLSLPVINHARNILIMVAGESKAAALYEVLHGEAQPSRYPAQAVSPVDGELVWLVDQAAAANLPPE
ncbi:MAG: 6-phosphogluconolactonase [Anaerolineae bacterium]|nr:6-phosphogluconolactonase [Anaerolineae bacterium]